jgi:hypothetical protein
LLQPTAEHVFFFHFHCQSAIGVAVDIFLFCFGLHFLTQGINMTRNQRAKKPLTSLDVSHCKTPENQKSRNQQSAAC